MWLEWLEDEQKLLGPGEDVTPLLGLYETALRDYKYYKVSRRYCKLILNLYYNKMGNIDEQRVRDVHERILQIYSLDFSRSKKFWEPYLQFEKD